jgi:hypothetical protein
VFSCVAGILGCAVIVWYGLGEMGSVQLDKERRKIERLEREQGTTTVGEGGVQLGGGGGGGERQGEGNAHGGFMRVVLGK